MGVLIIAEAGVNHNGDLNLALQLCKAAKEAGADIIKFQTFKTERVITKNTALATYQANNIGSAKTQYEMIKELELSFESFRKIKEYCDQIGIEFLSTPDDIDSLDFLVNDLKVRTIKIGSGEITNIPFLRVIALTHLPVILSTGMATLGEVERAIAVLMASGSKDITLLHCTSNYPCPYDEVNLRAMGTLRKAFGCNVGYSDHTQGISVPIAAVALGASVIEKHFTLDKSLPGPDHSSSINQQELHEMVTSIRNIEAALGNGIKKPTQSELDISRVVRRKIVASKLISKGVLFSSENLTTKRTSDDGLPAEMWDYVIGHPAPKDYIEDEAVNLW